MLDIGRHIDTAHFDEVGETILGVMNSVDRNKTRLTSTFESGLLNLTIANTHQRLEISPYKEWRVIAYGMLWSVASTANEDPIVEFGYSGDSDAFGKITSAITGGEKYVLNDHVKYDPLDLLAPIKVTEASATLVTTYTEGAQFGVWQKVPHEVWAEEAAVAGMSSGFVRPYMLIEIKTGGKW